MNHMGFNNGFDSIIPFWIGLDPGSQILGLILMILAFIAVGYVVYGILFLTWQIIKFTVMFAVLSIMWSIIIPWMLIVLIFEPKNLRDNWSVACDISQRVISTFYKSSNGTKTIRPLKSNEKQITPLAMASASGNHSYTSYNRQSRSPIIILRERDNTKLGRIQEDTMKESVDNVNNSNEVNPSEFPSNIYCPNCGNEFSSNNITILADNGFTFCEHCGEKFDKFQYMQK